MAPTVRTETMPPANILMVVLKVGNTSHCLCVSELGLLCGLLCAATPETGMSAATNDAERGRLIGQPGGRRIT
eukprot:scaffold117845_cov46-Prasinocladus_malaysianus.AAC.1